MLQASDPNKAICYLSSNNVNVWILLSIYVLTKSRYTYTSIMKQNVNPLTLFSKGGKTQNSEHLFQVKLLAVAKQRIVLIKTNSDYASFLRIVLSKFWKTIQQSFSIKD